MSTGTLLAIIIAAVVILALIAVGIYLAVRRRRLRERFGPEYERTVEGSDSRLAAERKLSAREKRHDELDIKPLPDDARNRYARQWRDVQNDFVDHPEGAVHDADILVAALMHERGYPTENFTQRLEDLSVEHGRTLEHYRAAHEVNELGMRHKASTEQLRGAMVHYRALFNELLSNGGQTRHAPA
ncbi:hypothetical protein LRS74_01335 [Streptomyces sp. LX-29]|uniref:hypothetical protein n=1 Tax=Streptomyces sp. LX-29 TaxID=2900152 RepID=UPI00240D50E2|nr:hypothetical protein [Streptomyces sp. LX-29]WFB05812.1 hypothetical protein LRS74_01335 [Streptomyces sp. LX-29]